MTDQSTLGLALIARDEEKYLPNLLHSSWNVFDQVVLVDTGSTDRTIDVFEKWAKLDRPSMGVKVEHFTWCDDFAAARNAAWDLLDTDYCCWADCDDVLYHPLALKQVVRSMAAEGTDIATAAYVLPEESHTTNRTRIARRGVCTWVYPLHEDLAWADPDYSGTMVYIPPDVTHWIHKNDRPTEKRKARNLAVARKWLADEPDNALAAAYVDDPGGDTIRVVDHGELDAESAAALALMAEVDGSTLLRVE